LANGTGYGVAQDTKLWYKWWEEGFMPGKNTSFSIGDHFMGFVDSQVKEGRYSNASDVMRAALRLLEEREAKLTALRAALIEGEESGPSTPFDFEAFIARKRNATPKPA
jgi:antitoxin ParD1/3/4